MGDSLADEWLGVRHAAAILVCGLRQVKQPGGEQFFYALSLLASGPDRDPNLTNAKAAVAILNGGFVEHESNLVRELISPFREAGSLINKPETFAP
jgi:hypothetical protein